MATVAILTVTHGSEENYNDKLKMKNICLQVTQDIKYIWISVGKWVFTEMQ